MISGVGPDALMETHEFFKMPVTATVLRAFTEEMIDGLFENLGYRGRYYQS